MTSETPSLDWWRFKPQVQGPATTNTNTTAAPEAAESAASKWAFRGLIFFTIINVGAPQVLVPGLEQLRLAMLSAVAAILGYAIEQFSGLAKVPPRPRELTLVLLLVIWATVTVPMSLWPGGSVQVLTDQYIKTVIIFWLLARVIRKTSHLRTMFWTLSALSFPLALTGVQQFKAGQFQFGRIVGYSSGVANNPNDLAMMLDLILPLTAVLAFRARTALVRIFALAMIGANLACLTITFSRAGFLGLVAILAAGAWTAIRRGQWKLIALVLVLLPVGAVLAPQGYFDRLSTISSVDADETGSAQARWAGMVAAVDWVKAHPIAGGGVGQDYLALMEVQGDKGNWLHVHDTYLIYAVDLGLVGLALFVAMIFYAYRGLARVERECLASGQDELSMMATAVRLSMIGLAVTAFFAPVAYNFPFYYVTGLAVALPACQASSQPMAVPPASTAVEVAEHRT